MLVPEEKETIEKGFSSVLIIWGAMLASLFIYVFISHVAGDQIRQTQKPEFPIALMRNILFCVAAAELLLAYYLRKRMLRVHPETPAADIPLKTEQPKALAKYTTAVIVSLALSECIGIYGLMLFLLGDEYQTLYIFIGVAAIAMYYFRPKKDELIELAVAMHGGEIQPPHMLH